MLQQLPRRLVSDTLLLIALGFQRGFQPLFLFAAEPARLMRAIPENKLGCNTQQHRRQAFNNEQQMPAAKTQPAIQ